MLPPKKWGSIGVVQHDADGTEVRKVFLFLAFVACALMRVETNLQTDIAAVHALRALLHATASGNGLGMADKNACAPALFRCHPFNRRPRKKFLRFEGGHATLPGRGHRLAIDVVGHIAGSKHAANRGCGGVGCGLDVTGASDVKLTGKPPAPPPGPMRRQTAQECSSSRLTQSTYL